MITEPTPARLAATAATPLPRRYTCHRARTGVGVHGAVLFV